jgi:hypothetical protein
MVALLLPTNGFPPYTMDVFRVTTADTTVAPWGMASVLQEMMEPLQRISAGCTVANERTRSTVMRQHRQH